MPYGTRLLAKPFSVKHEFYLYIQAFLLCLSSCIDPTPTIQKKDREQKDNLVTKIENQEQKQITREQIENGIPHLLNLTDEIDALTISQDCKIKINKVNNKII